MDKWLYRSALVLSVIGILVSIYMTIYKLTGNVSMCLGSGDCSIVNASPYSVIYGIPLGVIGIIGYGAILVLLLAGNSNEFLRQNSSLFTFGLALTGFLFTLYLIYIEFVVLKALCPFCLTSQIVMSILFILSIIRLIRQPQ